MPLGVMPAVKSSGMHRGQLSAGNRKVYAARRHDRSLCTQKQPETHGGQLLARQSQSWAVTLLGAYSNVQLVCSCSSWG